MRNRPTRGFLFLVLAATVGGCDSPRAPTAPSAVSPPPMPAPTPLAGRVMSEVTLSGIVYETTPAGMVPIEGVAVYCEPCGVETHTGTFTDSNGFYSFYGVWLEALPTRLHVRKNGYVDPLGLPRPTPPNPTGPGWREVRVNGDTRFDVELVRQ